MYQCHGWNHIMLYQELQWCNFSGYTAAHFAAAWGKVKSLQTLMDSGADMELKTVYGETPRDVAKRYKQFDCIAYYHWAGYLLKWFFYACYLIIKAPPGAFLWLYGGHCSTFQPTAPKWWVRERKKCLQVTCQATCKLPFGAIAAWQLVTTRPGEAHVCMYLANQPTFSLHSHNSKILWPISAVQTLLESALDRLRPNFV